MKQSWFLRLLRGGIALLFMLGFFSVPAFGALSHVVLTHVGDPARSIAINWYEEGGAGIPQLQYDQDASFATPITVSGAVTRSREEGDYCRVTLTGLLPEKTYYYRFQDGDTLRQFTTAPAETDRFRFVYFGDVQFNSNETMEEDYLHWSHLASRANRQVDPAFVLQGGDMVNNGLNRGQWNAFLAATSAALPAVPILVTAGNHESNSVSGKPEWMLDLLALAEDGPAGFEGEFYSFDYGNCHFTVVNSCVFLGEQELDAAAFERLADWIVADLAGSDSTWNIVMTHYPAYVTSDDEVGAAVLKNWAPLFAAGGVDLVLCGHQHAYMRTYPQDGVVYVMATAGRKFYTPQEQDYASCQLAEVSTYQVVEIDGDALLLTTYDDTGRLLDRYRYGEDAPPEAWQNPFVDVREDDWFYEPVAATCQDGLLRGMDVDHFGPEQPMTRAMFVTALSRLAGADTAPYVERAFSDVAAGDWYAASVAWGVETGLVAGYGDGCFGPEDPISREQACALLSRYLTTRGWPTVAAATQSFRDAEAVSGWARESVANCAFRGLVQGNDRGYLLPLDVVTRAEAASMLARYSGRYL